MGVRPAAALTERRLNDSIPPRSSSSRAWPINRCRVFMYTLYTLLITRCIHCIHQHGTGTGSTDSQDAQRMRGGVADFGPMTGVDLQTENVAHLIQLALGPVFLISGVGITLSMLTQRLARIVDRARTLEEKREATSSEKKLA